MCVVYRLQSFIYLLITLHTIYLLTYLLGPAGIGLDLDFLCVDIDGPARRIMRPKERSHNNTADRKTLKLFER